MTSKGSCNNKIGRSRYIQLCYIPGPEGGEVFNFYKIRKGGQFVDD